MELRRKSTQFGPESGGWVKLRRKSTQFGPESGGWVGVKAKMDAIRSGERRLGGVKAKIVTTHAEAREPAAGRLSGRSLELATQAAELGGDRFDFADAEAVFAAHHVVNVFEILVLGRIEARCLHGGS